MELFKGWSGVFYMLGLLGAGMVIEMLFPWRRTAIDLARWLRNASMMFYSMIILSLFPVIAAGTICSTPRTVLHYKTHRARVGDGIIFFRQKRVGKNGTLFNFIKFRSQRLGAERIAYHGIGTKEMANDPRQYP
ncbi:MAG: sugar transferase, partial [Marinicaulis sp.]|nr:sugar transferase [Marinicaulis sp.]